MDKFLDKIAHKIDIYGQTLSINVKGKQKITSKLGAICTLFTISIAAAYGIERFIKMMQRSSPTIN